MSVLTTVYSSLIGCMRWSVAGTPGRCIRSQSTRSFVSVKGIISRYPRPARIARAWPAIRLAGCSFPMENVGGTSTAKFS